MNTQRTNTEQEKPHETREYKNHVPVVMKDYELLEAIHSTHQAATETLFNAVIGAMLEYVSFEEWAELLAGAIIQALAVHSFEPTPIIAELIDRLDDSADAVEEAVRFRDAELGALADIVKRIEDPDLRGEICRALGL